MNEVIGIDFVGGSTGLQDAVLASQRALQALNRDTSRMSFTLGRIMRTIVAPIASVIISAFAAKRALSAFTQSTLPGAAQLNQSLAFMNMHVLRLSEAVGQLLAPAAERAAAMISRIAQFLEPLIRRLTAAMPQIGANLRQIAMNFVGFLRPIIPTVFGIVDRIIGAFQNANWADIMATLQQVWQRVWTGIITFTAPILVRIATLIDTVVRVVRAGLGAALDWVNRKAAEFGVTLPNALRFGVSYAEILQTGIITVISAIEVAMENIPLLFNLVVASGRLAIQFLGDNWRGFGEFLLESMKVATKNIVTLFTNLGTQLTPIFEVMGQNIAEVLGKSIEAAILTARNTLIREGAFLANPSLANPQTVGEQWMRTAFDAAVPPTIKPTFDLKRLPNMDLPGLVDGIQGMPNLKLASANMKEFSDVLAQISKTFGAGIAKRLQDAFLRGPQLVAQLMQGVVPGWGLGGPVAPRVDRMDLIAPLLFGSREAAMNESNQASKNPMFQVAQQQLQLTREQLVEQRAARAAAERKARIANF